MFKSNEIQSIIIKQINHVLTKNHIAYLIRVRVDIIYSYTHTIFERDEMDKFQQTIFIQGLHIYVTITYCILGVLNSYLIQGCYTVPACVWSRDESPYTSNSFKSS